MRALAPGHSSYDQYSPLRFGLSMHPPRCASERVENREERWVKEVHCVDGRTLFFDVSWPQRWLSTG